MMRFAIVCQVAGVGVLLAQVAGVGVLLAQGAVLAAVVGAALWIVVDVLAWKRG